VYLLHWVWLDFCWCSSICFSLSLSLASRFFFGFFCVIERFPNLQSRGTCSATGWRLSVGFFQKLLIKGYDYEISFFFTGSALALCITTAKSMGEKCGYLVDFGYSRLQPSSESTEVLYNKVICFPIKYVKIICMYLSATLNQKRFIIKI